MDKTLLGLFTKEQATKEPVSEHKVSEHKAIECKDWGIYRDTLKAVTSLFTIILAVIMALCDGIYHGVTKFGYRLAYYLNRERSERYE